MVGFREPRDIERILLALRNYWTILANDLPYLSPEDQVGLEEEMGIFSDMIEKIEFEFPWMKIDDKFWSRRYE